jgi:hypothetical protein
VLLLLPGVWRNRGVVLSSGLPHVLRLLQVDGRCDTVILGSWRPLVCLIHCVRLFMLWDVRPSAACTTDVAEGVCALCQTHLVAGVCVVVSSVNNRCSPVCTGRSHMLEPGQALIECLLGCLLALPCLLYAQALLYRMRPVVPPFLCCLCCFTAHCYWRCRLRAHLPLLRQESFTRRFVVGRCLGAPIGPLWGTAARRRCGVGCRLHHRCCATLLKPPFGSLPPASS